MSWKNCKTRNRKERDKNGLWKRIQGGQVGEETGLVFEGSPNQKGKKKLIKTGRKAKCDK